jgi:hypothetical protein
MYNAAGKRAEAKHTGSLPFIVCGIAPFSHWLSGALMKASAPHLHTSAAVSVATKLPGGDKHKACSEGKVGL